MSDPLQRGAVVLCGMRYSVVWEVCGAALVLLPIIRPRRQLAIDVVLDLADLAACAVPIVDAVVRPRRNPPIAAAGHQVVGEVPGRTMCRVVQGVIRANANDAHHAKWAAEARQMEHLRDDRCVNLTA